MASWMYSGVNAGFKVNKYVPLQATMGEIFTTPFHVVVDYEYSYYSTLYYTQNTTSVHFECDLTGYAGTIGSESKYPALVCYLSQGQFGSEQCGVRIATENYYSANVSGTDNTNGTITDITTGYYGGAFNGAWTQDGEITVHASNIPIIFEDADVQTMGQYLWRINNTGSGGNLSDYAPNNNPASVSVFETAINFQDSGIFGEDTKEYFVNETYNAYTVERGIVSSPEQATYIRAERILYNGDKICFYRDNTNPFLLTLITGNDIVGSKFSNSSYQDLLEVPYEEFTLDDIEYTTPFYSPYKADLGVTDYEGYLATVWSTNIPIYSDFATAQQYLDGDIDITSAENWDRISSNPVYKDTITNNTGLPDELTEFGESFVQSFFSQQYLCTVTALNEIAFSLYDVGVGNVWELIKEGVEMYGSNAMECVQGLMFFPLDLSTVYSNVMPQNYVYFGGYKLDLQNSSVNKIIFPNGYKSIGTINIVKSFNDYRDYEPYTKLYIYLPYCGTFQLQLSRYYGKTTEVRYYIDTRTGGCLVCLIANGVLTDYFNGQMGVQMPITLTDKSSYSNAQIQTLLGGLNGFGGIAKNVSAGIAGGYSAPITLAFGALQAGLNVAKTEYDLTQNNINDYNKTKGGSTSMLNEFLPQYVTFMFEIQQANATDNEISLQGLPSNASGTIGSFSGYLEVEEVNLLCGTATENEKKQIINMLRSGVII